MTIRVIIGMGIGMAIGAVIGYFGKCSSGACPLTANPFRGAIYGGVMGALFALSVATNRAAKQDREATEPTDKTSDETLAEASSSQSETEAKESDQKGGTENANL